ncbi:MAG: Fic family protein [Oligoflexia bacterium]|nr:Fic family protein [Oligoflexia bacterium]
MLEKNANKLIKLISELDEFKGRWFFLQNIHSGRLPALYEQAVLRSVAAMDAFDNFRVTDSLKQGRLEAMAAVFDKNNDSSFEIIDELLVKHIHSALFKYSLEDQVHSGKYKTMDVNIDGVDKDGRLVGNVLDSVSPSETPAKMLEFIELTNNAFNEGHYHPLIIISLFVVNFLSIQPFQKGNIPVALLAASYMLDRKGYGFTRYASLEKIVSSNLENFYYSILKSQKRESANDVLFWIVYFIKCLVQIKNEVLNKLDKQLDTHVLNPLSQRILELMDKHDKINITMLQTLTKANRNTLKIRLRELVRGNFITQYGKAKATWYCKAAL